MPNLVDPSLKSYRVEFLRRACRLRDALDDLFNDGRNGDLLPSLFSMFSYLWSGRNMFREDVASKLYH